MSSDETSRAGATSSESNAASYLRTASITRSASPLTDDSGPLTASGLFNAGNFDPAKLHPMANLGDNLDFLVLEDDKRNQLPGAETALPSRGWTDDLCYGTGTTYLSGVYPYL